MDKTLDIEELNSEAMLSLMAIIEGKQVELPLTMAQLSGEEKAELQNRIKGSILALEVVMMEGAERPTIINFKNAAAEMTLYAVVGEDAYRWDNVRIGLLQLKTGRRVHVLKPVISAGQKHNRRKGLRLDMDITMEILQDGRKVNVLVQDISYCGLRILERGGSQLDKEQPFIVALIDDNKGERKPVINLDAKIVRQKVFENGDVESGCIIAKGQQDFLQRYVAIKQMERIRGGVVYKTIARTDTTEDWKKNTAEKLSEEI